MKKNTTKYLIILGLLVNFPIFFIDTGNSSEFLKLDEIHIRDPNIIYDNETETYYMTGTTASDGFLAYYSYDMQNWTYHGYIYSKNESNFWAKHSFWAPEILKRNNQFYLFFTAKSDDTMRATGVAVSDNPLGPYVDLMVEPLTPAEYDCLDGHLYKNYNGTEYLIYVYEWLQNGTSGIGEMWIQEISSDYKELLGTPTKLFKGGDADWSNAVIDGPSMLYHNSVYYLFWSSFDGDYKLGYAYSDNLLGPYQQSKNPIFGGEGGHSTWFEINNIIYITFHSPNSETERAIIDILSWNEKKEIWILVNNPLNYQIPGYSMVITISLIFASIIFIHLKKKWNLEKINS